jgi:dTDP-4-amino-4,6-dideoxygalactose transaminase
MTHTPTRSRTRPRSLGDEVIASVVDTLEDGRLFRYDCESPADSPVSVFEREFAAMLGARYAVAVNSCSSALYLSLLACGVAPGDEVVVPAFTFIAVPSAVVHAQARPVLVEVTDDYAIDLDDLERKITPRTKALLLSYMRGYAPDVERVVEVCDRHGVTVIEDVAHGLGETWNSVPLGRFGRVAAFSFQSYKLLDGGEGGMVVSDDRDIARNTILRAGCYDRTWQCHFVEDDDRAWLEEHVNTVPAYGMRLSNLTASVLRPQLSMVDTRIQQHDERYARMREGLVAADLRFADAPPQLRPVRDSLQFELPALEPTQVHAFVASCRARELPLHVFGLDPTNARCFWNWKFFVANECPHTRALLSRTADMPLPLWLDASILDYFADSICASLADAGAGS